MHISISIDIHPSAASASTGRPTIALDELIERYTGLTPLDMAAQIHTLCGDQHIDRDAVDRLLRKYGGAPEDVARALTDLFGDEQPNLAPEARRLRAALIRFAACVLDGIGASDE